MTVEIKQFPVDTCLQCEQTREGVKRDETICGIEGGYEYRELEAEWPRHHWRDWSDRELKFYLKPEAFDKYRRSPLSWLQYADCEDTLRGHNFSKEDLPEYGIKKGVCWECSAVATSSDSRPS